MKLKLYSLLMLFSGLLLFSCKTAEKLYQQGRYDEAVELATKKLQKKPGDAAMFLLDLVRILDRNAQADREIFCEMKAAKRENGRVLHGSAPEDHKSGDLRTDIHKRAAVFFIVIR